MNKYLAFKILRESGKTVERIDEAKGTFSKRRFERAVQSAFKSVQSDYLATKDARPCFETNGSKIYWEVKYKEDGSVIVYTKCTGPWFVDGVMRKLTEKINDNLEAARVNLMGNEKWTYSSSTAPSGRSYCEYIYLQPREVKQVSTYHDSLGKIYNWNPRGRSEKIRVGGAIRTFRPEKRISKRQIDNGSRQMLGYVIDDLWLSEDKQYGVLVHTSCINPIAGEDVSAKLITGDELKKYL